MVCTEIYLCGRAVLLLPKFLCRHDGCLWRFGEPSPWLCWSPRFSGNCSRDFLFVPPELREFLPQTSLLPVSTSLSTHSLFCFSPVLCECWPGVPHEACATAAARPPHLSSLPLLALFLAFLREGCAGAPRSPTGRC